MTIDRSPGAGRRVLSRRAGLLLVATLLAAAAMSSPASAAACGTYPDHATDGYHFPGIGRVTIRGAGCGTALRVSRAIRRTVSARIDAGRAGDVLPRSLRADGRRYRCRYRVVTVDGGLSEYTQARCATVSGRTTIYRARLSA